MMPPMVEMSWHQDARDVILEVTKELNVQASRYGPEVYFPPVGRVVAKLSVFWYHGVRRYGFVMEWPSAWTPSLDYIREVARMKIEAIQEKIAHR